MPGSYDVTLRTIKSLRVLSRDNLDGTHFLPYCRAASYSLPLEMACSSSVRGARHSMQIRGVAHAVIVSGKRHS